MEHKHKFPLYFDQLIYWEKK